MHWRAQHSTRIPLCQEIGNKIHRMSEWSAVVEERRIVCHSLITYDHCHIGDLLARNMLGYYSGISNGIVDDHHYTRPVHRINYPVRDANGMSPELGLYRFIYCVSRFSRFSRLLSSFRTCGSSNATTTGHKVITGQGGRTLGLGLLMRIGNHIVFHPHIIQGMNECAQDSLSFWEGDYDWYVLVHCEASPHFIISLWGLLTNTQSQGYCGAPAGS